MTSSYITFHPVVYTVLGLFTQQQGKKGGLNRLRATNHLVFWRRGVKHCCWLVAACLKGRPEAWGEVSTFSAYLTFSCLMFRNSTRLIGSQRWGSTQIQSRSAYMNQEEFPILILSRPLIIRQYITCIISLLGCRIISISQLFPQCFPFVVLTFRVWYLGSNYFYP